MSKQKNQKNFELVGQLCSCFSGCHLSLFVLRFSSRYRCKCVHVGFTCVRRLHEFLCELFHFAFASWQCVCWRKCVTTILNFISSVRPNPTSHQVYVSLSLSLVTQCVHIASVPKSCDVQVFGYKDAWANHALHPSCLGEHHLRIGSGIAGSIH